jgi:hypothetical protein
MVSLTLPRKRISNDPILFFGVNFLSILVEGHTYRVFDHLCAFRTGVRWSS